MEPQDSFHVVRIADGDQLTGIEPVADMDMRINGGYFVLRQQIFEYLNEGDDLVMDGCVRAAKAGRFRAVPLQRLLGCRWTPSRSGPTPRACTAPAAARGPCGDPESGHGQSAG